MNTIADSSHLISVILPVHNAEKFLSNCLDSLLSQNYENIEIIAIDDKSSDKSYKILRKYKISDNRIKIYKNVKKYGLAVTLNRCLRRAKGKFLVFMDAKDSITKNKLQKQLQYLLANPKVVAVGTQCMYINQEDKRIGKSNFPILHEHISQKPLHGISVLFEGIMINKFTIPKDLLRFSSHKHLFLYSDMTMQLLQYGQLANLGEYLQFHRKRSSSLHSQTTHFFSLLKLWLASRFQYDVMPSFRSFFSGIFKTTTS